MANATAAPTTNPDHLCAMVRAILDDNKGEDIVVINLQNKTALADYMVICTGRSTRHVSSMAEHLLAKLSAHSPRAPKAEGLAQGDWVVIDAGDVIIHLFRPEVRSFYNLEKMWGAELPNQPTLVS